MNAAVNAEDVLKASTDYVNEGLKHPRKDKIVDFSRGTVLLRIGQNDYAAEVVVAQDKEGMLSLYDIVSMKKAKHELRNGSADSAEAVSPLTANAGDRHTESSMANVAQPAVSVNAVHRPDTNDTARHIKETRIKSTFYDDA